jgi:acetylornithine/N-succinyldiaminopimelate aminotransferase
MSGLSPSPPEPADPLNPLSSEDASKRGQLLDFSGGFGCGFEQAPARGETQSACRPDDAARPTGFDQEAPRGAESLIEKLVDLSFGDRAFLLPSAPAARRIALDMIRGSHRAAGRPKRRRLIICAGASAHPESAPAGLDGDNEVMILRTDDLSALSGAIKPDTAGFLIAPVRTENGLDVLAGSVLAGLREMADDYGVILAFDETFCGLGRSGMVWAHEWTGVTPDLMISTDGLAGASPLAALVATQKVARGAPASLPAADPAAVEAAHAVMEFLGSPGFEERVQNLAWRLEDRLASLL